MVDAEDEAVSVLCQLRQRAHDHLPERGVVVSALLGVASGDDDGVDLDQGQWQIELGLELGGNVLCELGQDRNRIGAG